MPLTELVNVETSPVSGATETVSHDQEKEKTDVNDDCSESIGEYEYEYYSVESIEKPIKRKPLKKKLIYEYDGKISKRTIS